MIERMDDFFAARVEGYEEHMMTEVVGCKEAYEEMTKLVPDTCEKLLDLGCGTGLELEGIFKKLPELVVTGVDLTQAMLDKLVEKFADKKINVICGNYFDVCFGAEKYDCAVSFETMHHFSHEAKIGLYEKIRKALKTGGIYIECDYMVVDQEEEDHWYAENERIRKELRIMDGEVYHYDTPCTIDNQISMFLAAGFAEAEKVFRVGNTTIIVAKKAEVVVSDGDAVQAKRKYFCTEAERQGTCYHEFQKGKWDEHTTFWKEDSLLLHDDVHLELKLYGLFKQVLPKYDAYGDVEVSKAQWQEIYTMAEEIGGEVFEAIKEADVWVQECFETEDVFYMLGI